MISWSGTFYAPVTSGSQDALIAKAADALAAFRQPVFLRWAWEMNGNWYDWGGPRNGNNPAGFVAAWRHIHDIFVAHKAVNVAWVWGPNAGSAPEQAWNAMGHYYPGDAYVDWVGISGYFTGRETPASLFAAITSGYGNRKPIMIAETGALERGGTVKADWIRALDAWIVAHPAVGALVWFDTNNDKGNTKDWRIDSSPSSLAAYKEMAADPRFTG
jgi:beta-mannanase